MEGISPFITIKGTCMQDAINRFYKTTPGAELMQVYDSE